jgi:hypothetical protein
MIQSYHHYSKWEDYINGMYRTLDKKSEKEFLDLAVCFTGDHELYGSWMLKVIVAWPFACEHNLTNTNVNRKAWIGHSACCMAIQCPEYITRKAWSFLSKQQQKDANQKALEAIELWEKYYAKKIFRN